MQSTSTTVSSQQQQRSLPTSTTQPPRLTLSPYISPSTGYKFPSIYSFPPFFTKQPNLTTWQHQQQQWIQLILSHSRHTRCSRLELSNESIRAMELFTNREINRSLPLPILLEILTTMSTSSPPSAEFIHPSTSSKSTKVTNSTGATGVWIFWKRPEEWANTIYEWIKQTGQQSSILTFYDLVESTEVEQLEFYRLPEPLLRRSLEVLMRQGKCQVLKGVGEEGDGVKFV